MTDITEMTTWIIEPHDPMIFRDGRPFGATPGVQATSLDFPFPSTTTGGVRTRTGLDSDGLFDKSQIETLKKLQVRGPLLVQLEANADSTAIDKWLVPAPQDALLFEPPSKENANKPETPILKQLVPLQLPEGTQTDFATDENNLGLIGLPHPDPSKPAKNAPHYWYWETFQDWLINPAIVCQKTRKKEDIEMLGHSGPQKEQRTHVSIDPSSETAKEGYLFTTHGLEFTHLTKQALSTAKRLALAIAVDKIDTTRLLEPKENFASLGGERRMVSWHKSEMKFPPCPDDVVKAIADKKACRLFLLTPAYFRNGYYPDRQTLRRQGIMPDLKAIAIHRPQVVSGWDLEKRAPKPTRRLAPAGTVLFLSFAKDTHPDALKEWVKAVWMQCISDSEQERLDGFGLVALGTWSGEPEKLKPSKGA